MKLTLRTQLLLATAIGVALYVALVPAEVGVSGGGAVGPAPNSTSSTASRNAPTGAALSMMRLARRVSGTGAVDALFSAHFWNTQPAVAATAPIVPVKVTHAAPPVPQAPPLPFVFIGSYTPIGGASVFFLTWGDKVYDVHVGDTVNQTYKVAAYDHGQLLLTYLPLNQEQSLAVGGSP